MSWLWYLYALVCILAGLRLRKRLAAISVLPPVSPSGEAADVVWLTAEGVTVDQNTRDAAASFVAARGLRSVDILPGNIGVLELMRLFQRVDPVAYRTNRIGIGYTAGYALLATSSLLRQAGVEKSGGTSLFDLARTLKTSAIDRVDVVVAPKMQSPAPAMSITDPEGFREAFGQGARFLATVQAAILLFLVAGFFVNPIAAALAIICHHLQPLLAIAGLAFRPRDFWVAVLLRSPLEFALLLRQLFSATPTSPVVEDHRKTYKDRIADGVQAFFEPRREDCPFCGSREIRPHVRTTDLFQGKPGRFVLDRCRSCGHVFQNPRLNIRGLDYYYADFYDGLGARDMERLFGAGSEAYARRLKSLRKLTQPKRWLDVGAAHGHFCCYAKGELPDTEFHGLEMSAAIEEAVRAGWVDRGYRGVFPDIAPELAGQYDVVSSFHCLEHVPDPPLEIRAAHTALVPGGYLLIEVPNPECKFGAMFGRFWMPWLQPQHLNMYSSKNLCELLRQHGFTPVHVEGTAREDQFDILASALTLLGRLAPRTGMPWQPPPTIWRQLRRGIVWTFGFPFVVLAFLADKMLAPFFRSRRFDSSFRVIARKTSDTTMSREAGAAESVTRSQMPVGAHR